MACRSMLCISGKHTPFLLHTHKLSTIRDDYNYCNLRIRSSFFGCSFCMRGLLCCCLLCSSLGLCLCLCFGLCRSLRLGSRLRNASQVSRKVSYPTVCFRQRRLAFSVEQVRFHVLLFYPGKQASDYPLQASTTGKLRYRHTVTRKARCSKI